MRGLVVLVAIIVLASMFLGNVTTAETKKDTTVLTPAVISCTTSNGTYVTFRANTPINNLEIGTICRKDSVPAGWTVQCYTDEKLDGVDVSFETGSGPKQTHVTCG